MKLLIFLSLILLVFTACGRDQTDENDEAEQNGGAFGVHLADSFTLTISTPTGIPNMNIESAAANFTSRMADEGIDVNVVIETYIWEERDIHFERKLGRFAAGIGPDIFVPDGFPLYPFMENGFIRDIYPLIDASENWSREDFFENALRGYEIDGRLYVMPMSFGFDFVGINANVPREFLNRFAQKNYVSINELAALYNELASAYPQWGEYAFINFHNLINSFRPEINSAIDFAGQRAVFGQSVADALNDLRNAFVDNNRFGTEMIFTHSEEDVRMLQERYVFFRPIGVSGAPESLFDFQTTYFTDFVPIANKNGELINTTWGFEVAVNANTDSALAWAFIEELISTTAERGDFSASSHISRRHARHYLVSGLETALTQFIIRPIAGSQTSAINQAAERIIGYGDMPIAMPSAVRYFPVEVYIDVLWAFDEGSISAAETLSQIETRIAEWFLAQRPPITPYVPAAIMVHYGPTQTLTVRTPNTHTGALEQAAEMMNASWRERGEVYAFELVVEDWNWADWEDA